MNRPHDDRARSHTSTAGLVALFACRMRLTPNERANHATFFPSKDWKSLPRHAIRMTRRCSG